ncbi:alpha/beta hydrolase [Castellaniella sp. GW247-6E4]|uniref:alpha/beta fold hydrolase n=1 Tax=Castellaniella sp. GW247-6E4 TaxID=3140380 RepID=UPI00331585C8
MDLYASERKYWQGDDGQYLAYIDRGQGPTILLLHGWPESLYAWRHVIPRLSQEYRVIAPDLPGLGDSDRALGTYAKADIAAQIRRLLSYLKIETCVVVGHDWGGVVAFCLAASYPEMATHLVTLDITIPGDGRAAYSEHGRRWHHALHQINDLPEILIEGREKEYYGWFWDYYGYKAGAITELDKQEYLRTYRRAGTLRTGLAYYRSIPEDARWVQLHLEQQGLIATPTLALGGAKAYGRGESAVESLSMVAKDVIGCSVPDVGHWLPEEAPAFVCDEILKFIKN